MRAAAVSLALVATPVLAAPLPSVQAVPSANAVLVEQEATMGRLLTWAGLSVVTGGLLAVAGPTALARDFGVQCLAWGAIDGGIALWARRDLALKRAAGVPDPAAERKAFRDVLLLNAGIDLAYVGTGAYLLTRPGLAGHGAGVALQGGFLLLFDSWHGWRASQPLVPLEPAAP